MTFETPSYLSRALWSCHNDHYWQNKDFLPILNLKFSFVDLFFYFVPKLKIMGDSNF